MSPRSSHESGVLKGRQPWKREARRDDQLVADRLEHILHDDVTETQVAADGERRRIEASPNTPRNA